MVKLLIWDHKLWDFYEEKHLEDTETLSHDYSWLTHANQTRDYISRLLKKSQDYMSK